MRCAAKSLAARIATAEGPKGRCRSRYSATAPPLTPPPTASAKAAPSASSCAGVHAGPLVAIGAMAVPPVPSSRSKFLAEGGGGPKARTKRSWHRHALAKGRRAVAWARLASWPMSDEVAGSSRLVTRRN